MYAFVKNLTLGCIIATVILSFLVLISNLVLQQPQLSQNDRHIMWIAYGKKFFVKSSSTNKQSKILIKTNPTLRDHFSFFKDKDPRTFRIFCIGGSTTRGWPFNPHLSYSKLLSVYLQDLLPEQKIEVINAGLCGSDSFSDIPLVKEILNYQPDLFLIYEGRNEELQIDFHIGFRSRIVKLHAWLLRHVYLYSFLQSRLSSNNNEFDHAQDIREFLSRKSKYEDNMLRSLFLQNMMTISKLVTQKGCTVALLTQVLNPEEIQKDSRMARINDWLREFAFQHQTILIDIDKAFRDSEKPTEELVIPISVHPDLEGYILMAKTVCKQLAKQDIIAPKYEWRWDNLKTDAQYLQQINLTHDFLSHVYLKRLGDFFEKKMNMHDLAKLYYERGNQYLQKRK